MKRTILSSVVTGVLLASSSAGMAASSNTSNAVENGKPFQALNSLIEANRALIDSSQADIARLESEIAALNTRVDALSSSLHDISTQVSSNTQDIQQAFQRIAAHDGDIAVLRNDLSALVLQHNEDIHTLNERLDSLESQIAALSAQGLALADLLNQRVAELRALIDANSVGIDALLLDVIALNAQITTINSQVNSLFIQQSMLSDQLAAMQTQLASLQASVDALKAGESAVADPCFTDVSIGQSIAGALTSGGTCVSSTGSGHAAQFYSFTLAQAAIVRVAMQGSPSGNGTLSDPFLYLHQGDRNGQVIGYDDDGGVGYDAQIETVLQPGIYTIEATAYSSTIFGTFLLSLTAP